MEWATGASLQQQPRMRPGTNADDTGLVVCRYGTATSARCGAVRCGAVRLRRRSSRIDRHADHKGVAFVGRHHRYSGLALGGDMPNLTISPRPAWLLQVLGRYLQYPTCPKRPDQVQRETRSCVNPAGYLQYLANPACFVGLCPGDGAPGWGGQGRTPGLGFRLPITHHGSPPPQPRGAPVLLGIAGRVFTGGCHTGGRYSKGMGRVVRFPPPAASGPEPVSPGHPVRHVPSVAGAVGWLRGGDVEHPEGRPPGVRHLVSGTVAPDRRSAGRGGAPPAKGR